MRKLSDVIDGGSQMVLKYQLMHEDLDALVSVKSVEDLQHMLEEHDRCESRGGSRLRTFLFPAKPVVIENQIGAAIQRRTLEQRYIDAINGIVRPTNAIATIAVPELKQIPSNISHISHSISSACSSPRSYESYTGETVGSESLFHNNVCMSSRLGMYRVRSSPSLCSLSSTQNAYQHNRHSSQNHRQLHRNTTYQCSRTPPIDPRRSATPERFQAVWPVGRSEPTRYLVDNTPQPKYF